MKEEFEAMRAARKERRLERLAKNQAAMASTEFAYETRNGGDVLLFREGTVKADFYPGTGRWRSAGKTHSGGAPAFLRWWKKQLRAQK